LANAYSLSVLRVFSANSAVKSFTKGLDRRDRRDFAEYMENTL